MGEDHDIEAISSLVGELVTRGATGEAIEAAVARTTPLTPAVRFELARSLREAGLLDAAHAQLALIEGESPGTDAARLALVERALDAGEWAAAIEAARDVGADSGFAGHAAAARATALLMSGASPEAEDAVRDATAPDATTAAFLAAWLASARGDEPVSLPQEALSPLILAFERALHAAAIDRAVELLRLFDHVRDVPPRARREVLAIIYLRNGMLDSAADEWGAAAQESGPDCPSMLGLARVAAARGDIADALTFAESALRLDPESAAAQQVVAALRGES